MYILPIMCPIIAIYSYGYIYIYIYIWMLPNFRGHLRGTSGNRPDIKFMKTFIKK